MADKPVRIRYSKDVAATDDRRAFFKGEEYTVPSLATAQRVHPDAEIVGYDLGNNRIEAIEKQKADSDEKPPKDKP